LTTGKVHANLPAPLNDVIVKMVAVEPDDRFQTAGEIEKVLSALTTREHPAFVPATRSRMGVALRAALVVACVLVGVTVLGYLETTAFNTTLGRTPPYDRESPLVWVQVGLQSLFLPTLYFAAFFIVLWAAKFVVRTLRLSRSVDQLLTDGATRTNSLSLK